jgi:hypothetical protein
MDKMEGKVVAAAQRNSSWSCVPQKKLGLLG